MLTKKEAYSLDHGNFYINDTDNGFGIFGIKTDFCYEADLPTEQECHQRIQKLKSN